MNKIPVFLHIPKNAGTYVLGVTMSLFRHYGISKGWRNKVDWNLNLRRILLQKEGLQIATAFVYDPEEVRETNKDFKSHPMDEYCNIVDISSFIEELKKKKIKLFSIIIEDRGLKFVKDDLYGKLCEQHERVPYYYTVFRNPYDRAVSMYHYITNSKSAHELTHKAITSKTFEDYIKSEKLEDSWLIRNLNDTPECQSITENDFGVACSILDNFKIDDILNVDELIDDVFFNCYGIKISNIATNEIIDKNTTSGKDKISFEQLDKETKNIFLVRTELDRNIYNKYCVNCTQASHN